MASLLPLATYNLALKPFAPVPGIADDFPVTIRLTLAAVDPEAVDDKAEPSTLRLLKRSNAFINDDSDDEDDEEDELDDEEEEEDAADDEDADEEAGADADDLDDDEDDEDIEDEVSEYVICTLSPKVQFQQTLDITITPDEEVYFVVTGSYPIHLSGNYVEHPADDSDEDSDEEDYEEDDEYDMTPDEDELLYDLEELEDASDIENKIEELVEKDSKKRAAEDDEEAAEEEAAPAAAAAAPKSKKAKKDDKKDDKKSVQFTKELEQGPTGSTLVEKKETKKEKKERAKKEAAAAVAAEEAAAPAEKKYPTKTLLGGVVTEDRKVGKGPQAKSGNKVGIRYIGKLKNGKVFDKNTSGKPFTFGLGKGECIKGFDLGVAGMAVGGERRVVIPAKMGYGSQALPGIPSNSELTFDIKLVSIK